VNYKSINVPLSDRAKRMNAPLLGKICIMCRFWCVEVSEKSLFPIERYTGTPSLVSCIERNTKKAQLPIARCGAYVLHILRMSCFSEISPSIIRSCAIFVIYKHLRPFSSHVEECETVCLIQPPIYFYVDVTTSLHTARNICCFNLALSVDAPNKESGKRKVFKKLEESSKGKIGGSHSCTPDAVWLEARQACPAPVGLRLFYHPHGIADEISARVIHKSTALSRTIIVGDAQLFTELVA